MPETPPDPDKSAAQQKRGRFRPGQSGNPSGRTKGSRNRASVMLDNLAGEYGAAVLRRVIAAAGSGNMAAADILLRRLWPPPKSRLVKVKLPQLATAADGVAALAALVAETASGNLAPDEGAALAGLVEAHGRGLALAELEARIAKLEAAAGGDRP